MAPLKFRAWHNGKMHDSFRYENISGKSFVGGSLEGGQDVSYEADGKTTVVMQSTGLTDKNGMEIFEGDIVRREGKLYPVVYLNGAFRTGHVIHAEILASHDEVIGNIYQNSKLIS